VHNIYTGVYFVNRSNGRISTGTGYRDPSHPSLVGYTKKDLAEASGISRSTLYNLLDKLETYQIIKPTRKIGSTQLYTLNQESSTTKAIMAFTRELSEIVIGKQISADDEELKRLR